MESEVMHVVRRGSGRPLLLVHGLGGSWRSWNAISPALAQKREVIMIDLPGHGGTPPEDDSGTFTGLVRSLEVFLEAEGLEGIDAVGSSMGARLVLELARRGMIGATIALDPGGFWRGWERTFFATTIGISVKLLKVLLPILPALCGSRIGRTLLLAQLSHHPWALDPDLITNELVGYATTATFDALTRDLAAGPEQRGPAANSGPVVIGWGQRDRLCLPRQAARAAAAFPTATLRWFKRSGHFPAWDMPTETVRLILEATKRRI